MIDARQPERPYHRLIAAVLAALSFALSAHFSGAVFDRLPHLEDEMAYLFQARLIARGDLVIASPHPALAYWQPFVIDHEGRRFGKYTIGWPAQLALGELMGQPWVINAFYAALTVALVYRLGRELFGPDAGVFAAALAALSPMALLLSGTLMGHTAALAAATAFIYACWRIERGQRPVVWGLAGGLALGLLIANRPLTAIAIALPFVGWGGLRLLSAARSGALRETLAPLLGLAAVALLISLVVPSYNYRAAGSPTANLYTFIWSYDRIGFGPGYGRSGHTLERAVNHLRYDLSLTAADLFGWQLEPLVNADDEVQPALRTHLLTRASFYPALGLSWLVFPFALAIAFGRRALLIAVWLALGLAILLLPYVIDDVLAREGVFLRDPRTAWAAVIVLGLWLLGPLTFLRSGRLRWAWLLVAVMLSVLIVQLTYWIGSQRYSTRYYFEALSAAALLGALPFAWLAGQRWGRISLCPLAHALAAGLLLVSFFGYSLPRIGLLKGFNRVDRTLIEAVEARRDGDRPVLVIVTGDDVRWRAYGSLMAVTGPYLDSPIVAARGSSTIPRAPILARFPDRQVIEMAAQGEEAWFLDAQKADE